MSVVPDAVRELATFLIPACIFAMMALALNIQWGHTGLFNAGVAAFLAIGAYTAAILMTSPAPRTQTYPGHLGGFSQPFAVAAVGAMLLSGLVGLLIAVPILRLRADYFAIATLALAEIIRLLLTNAESLTAGTIGVILIPRPFDPIEVIRSDPGLSDVSMAALAVAFVVMLFLAINYLTQSPWGRVLRGIREDEEATLALGKNVFSFRLQAFVLGCAVLGLAGAVLGSLLKFVDPLQFDPLATFTIYVMVILGGSANNRGVIVGAFLFYAFDWVSVRIPDFARLLGGELPPALVEKLPYLRLMAIGLLLVLLILYRPEGLLPERKRTYAPVA